ncbi:MAG: TetR/AcrR family transcriptional regulator [Oscillospiraceae bacterium]|nr:TetR/AcrR family transcriptional regulator [Oscillospiraceae bacterium]
MRGTKERILLTALQLFARDGYEAVSVSDIAEQLGITKGALYRHYKSKRDIFNSILARMEQRDAELARDSEVPEGTKEEMEEAYQAVSPEQIAAFSKTMLRYWAEDEFASLFRRMLILEQFRDPEMGRLRQQYLVSGPLGYLTDLFAALGLPEPQKAAAEFYGPMFLLWSVYDGAEDGRTVLALGDELIDAAAVRLEKGKE